MNRLSGFVERGDALVIQNLSGSQLPVQGSYPLATVTVYLPSTLTPAAIYSDSSGTSKPNPFTAATDGSYFFYTAEPVVDITFSGGGLSTPFTLSNVTAGGSLPFLIATTASELIASITALNATSGGTIYCAPGTYDLPAGAGPTVTKPINIIGPGASAGTIVFHPTGHDQAAFSFDNAGAGGTLNYCSISGFSFSSPDTSFRKIMIYHVDTWGFQVSRIAAADSLWSDASFLSEGVRSKGRFRCHMHDSSIHTDIPLHIMPNPRFAALDADHFWFGPALDLASTNGNPCIKVDATVVLSNTTFSGVALQKGGFEWAGTSATASLHLRFADCRFEQMTAGKWCVDISGTTSMQALSFDNIRVSPTGKGIRCRNVTQLNLTEVFDGGSTVALDIDGTVYNTKGDNIRVGGSTSVSLVNQKLVRAGSTSEETGALPSPFFEYQSTLSANGVRTVELGLLKSTFLGNGLANNGQVQLAATFDGTEKSIEFRVFARNASTGAAVGGVVYATGGASGTAVCPGSSTTFDAGNIGGKLTILWQSSLNIILLNQLGVAVDYAVKMTIYK
jgi:hypothetical protein